MDSNELDAAWDAALTRYRDVEGPVGSFNVALLETLRLRWGLILRPGTSMFSLLFTRPGTTGYDADERVEVDVADRHVTIVECRPPRREDFGPEWTRFPVVRLRYVNTSGLWSLFWRDRHLKFHAYDRVPGSANVEELLAEVDRDPTAIFWG